MEFNASSTSITVLDRYSQDFRHYMAEKVPEIQKWLINKKFVVPFAVECAIRDHAEWFELSFYKFSRTQNFYRNLPEFWIQERITQGLTSMEMMV